MKRALLTLAVLAGFVSFCRAQSAPPESANKHIVPYEIITNDWLTVTVYDEADLQTKSRVDAEGNITGAMVGVLPLAKKNALGDFSNATLGKTGYFMVVTTSPDPVYLAHPDAKRLLQPASADKSEAMTHSTPGGDVL